MVKRSLTLLCVLSCIEMNAAWGDPRVLIIGIDGAGGSYLQAANTPHLDSLATGGAARYDFYNEGGLIANPPDSYGASGVNWTTILTGASAASHGVLDNSFAGNNLNEVPSLFFWAKQHNTSLYTASIANWTPINTFIVEDPFSDVELGFDAGQLFEQDIGVRRAAVELLTRGDPDLMFLHFDQVDGAGHAFSWGSPQYMASIQTVDGLIGEVMSALNSRPGVISGAEDWLVLVTADHGATFGSFGHVASQGASNWEVPFIIHGPSVTPGVELAHGSLRDVATTALAHLGVNIFETTVEGRVVGIPIKPPNGIVGDVNQDGVVQGDGTGPATSDDVTAFVHGWLTTGHSSALEAYTHGDLNFDRVTDIADWMILNRLNPAIGTSILAAIAVPEPTCSSLSLIALCYGFRRRCSRLSPSVRSRGGLSCR